eukprot:INCI8796.1.p1 GENE.INCI8796.1~~INCI8796.1.p1  ORF type:complete len:432 (+),score=63.71 INCI8796.1:150-1445(+)
MSQSADAGVGYCSGCEENVHFLEEDPVCQICGTELSRLPTDNATSEPQSSAAATNPLLTIPAELVGSIGGGSAAPLFDLIDVMSGADLARLVEASAATGGADPAENEQPEAGATRSAAAAGESRDGSSIAMNPMAQLEHLSAAFSHFLTLPDVAPLLSNQAPPASANIVDKLPCRKVEENDRWLEQIRLSLGGMTGNIVAETAAFGGSGSKLEPGTTLELPLVAAHPLRAAEDLRNAGLLRGKAVLCERGGCTFAAKALRCQAAGAAAVIVIQSVNVWPYVMTDSSGDGKTVTIPILMVKKEHGLQMLATLRDSTETDSRSSNNQEADNAETMETLSENPTPNCSTLTIMAGKKDDVCSICFEAMVGESCTQLPCLHVYHRACIDKWLGMRNTCPTCRHALPTDDAEFNERIRREREAALHQRHIANTWYS